MFGLYFTGKTNSFFSVTKNAMSVLVVESWLLTHVFMFWRFKKVFHALSHIATPCQKVGYRENIRSLVWRWENRH